MLFAVGLYAACQQYLLFMTRAAELLLTLLFVGTFITVYYSIKY